MSLELWTTIASGGTFVVITATAIAAVIQLKHIRSSNQIAILNEFREVTYNAGFTDSMQFVRTLDEKLKDPAFRAQLEIVPLANPMVPIVVTLGLFENLGCYVRRGMLDADLICELYAPVVHSAWQSMAQAIVIMRRSRGDRAFAHFEYLAYLSKQWIDANKPVYPQGVPRLAPPDRWLPQDRMATGAKPT